MGCGREGRIVMVILHLLQIKLSFHNIGEAEPPKAPLGEFQRESTEHPRPQIEEK